MTEGPTIHRNEQRRGEFLSLLGGSINEVDHAFGDGQNRG
jgi:hypothetical protein